MQPINSFKLNPQFAASKAKSKTNYPNSKKWDNSFDNNSSYGYKPKPYKKFNQPINLFHFCNNLYESDPEFVNTEIWKTAINGKCYIHKEDDTHIKEVLISYLPVSNSFYNTSKNVLDLLNNCPNIESKWVSLPAYAKKGSPYTIADFQLATTGSKSSLDSDYDQTSIRECGEENGIAVEDEDLVGYSTLPDYDGKHVEAFVYSVNNVKQAALCDPVSKKTDNFNEKIMSWVIFNDPKDIIHRKRINLKESGDSAGELTVVMRVSDLKNLIKLCFSN